MYKFNNKLFIEHLDTTFTYFPNINLVGLPVKCTIT